MHGRYPINEPRFIIMLLTDRGTTLLQIGREDDHFSRYHLVMLPQGDKGGKKYLKCQGCVRDVVDGEAFLSIRTAFRGAKIEN